MPLTEKEELELLALLEQEERERVSPKLEVFRKPSRIKVAYGGRGAGAKSWSVVSLLCQIAQRKKTNILCTREIQLSLEESVYRLVINTIQRLGYPGWTVTKEYIKSPIGSFFHFRGLRDLRAASAIKGLEDIDVSFCEEAATVTNESLDLLIPTIRKAGSELWFLFNRQEESDPVYERFVKNPREDSIVVWLEPGAIDNPWWTAELQKEMEEDYKRDPDMAEHVWGGQPRKQGQKAVMSRTDIRKAMDNKIENPEGAIEIGVDVARFGDDKTVLYKRHGLKIIDMKEFVGQDTMRTANEAWDMAEHSSEVVIKVDDSGLGGGVTDKLNELSANVMPINFGGAPQNTDLYTSIADEMWFEFPVAEADIPDDPILMQELAGRQYDYDTKGRRKIESKKDFKKRLGRSPDRADAILLCYYNAEKYNYVQV
jgi:phage terminase large subunit